MRVFLLSGNHQIAEGLRIALSKSNIDVVHARSLEQAKRLLVVPPDILFVDYYLQSSSGIEMAQALQKEGLLGEATIWVTGYNLSAQQLEQTKTALSVEKYWPQPIAYLDVQEFLESQTATDSIVLSPVAVRMVGQVWASKSSAILTGEGTRIIFAEGALIREDPPNCFVEILEEDMLNYQPCQNLSGGDWNKTGSRLISLCQNGEVEAWIKDHRTSAFGFVLSIELNRLGLTTELVSFVSSRTSLHRANLTQQTHKQLYALWLLGVVKPEAAVERSRVERTLSLEERVEQHQDYSWIIAEYERLKDADPFVLLGIHGKADHSLISQAIQRMKSRYEGILKIPKLSEEIKVAASNMLELIRKSTINLHMQEGSSLPEEQKLFQYAKHMIEQANWEQAQKALTKAHQIKFEDVDILAHLGWVQFHASSENFDTAIENLLLALQLDSNHIETLVFLSKIYISKKDYESAVVFLRKAVKLTPESEIQQMRIAAEAEVKIIERSREGH